jgi:hypothetical protein
MKKLLLITLLFLNFVAFSQKVVLCEDYNKTTGVPSGINQNWDIKSTGSYVYVIYTQSKPITNKLTVYVDRKNEKGEYVAYSTEYVEATGRQNWAMLDYKFTESGEYKIMFLNNGKELASTYTKIGYQLGYEPEEENENNDEIDTYYYESSTVSLSEDINKTTYELINPIEGTTYLGSGREKEVYIVVEHDKAFKTKLFYIDINLGDDFLETLKLEVEENWDIAWHQYKFTKKGTYYIDVYNEDDTFVNTATIIIK